MQIRSGSRSNAERAYPRLALTGHFGLMLGEFLPGGGRQHPWSTEERFYMRLRSTLAAILFAGCTIQTQPPPPNYGYQNQQYQQQPPPPPPQNPPVVQNPPPPPTPPRAG